MQLSVYSENNWDDYKIWYIKKALCLDIYYDPFYLELEECITEGKRKVIVVEDGEDFLLYPFIEQFIPVPNFESYSDAISPYGYSGPYWSYTNNQFKLKSEQMVCDYQREHKIVNELIRYHFYYNQYATFELGIQNIYNRKVVIIDLQDTWDNIWAKEFSATNRNLIRKLEKEGYECFETCDLNLYTSFIELYYQTMDNAVAAKYYYFSKKYFEKLKIELGGKVKLFVVMKDGVLYNAALFFITNNIITYHLSARNLQYPKVPGSNYLLANVIKLFIGESWKHLNLGGGTNSDDNNHLLKFKQNFSKQTTDFFIGKRILLPELYQHLKEAYITFHGVDSLNLKQNIVQFYR